MQIKTAHELIRFTVFLHQILILFFMHCLSDLLGKKSVQTIMFEMQSLQMKRPSQQVQVCDL